MLGHRIAFRPGGTATAYGMTTLPHGYGAFGAYGAPDTGRYFKITSDGTVFFKGGIAEGRNYLIAFDGPAREKIISGDPGGYVNFSMKPWRRDVSSEDRKRELDAATVDSRSTYAEAEKRAKEIVEQGEAALTTAGKNVIAPTIQASSGSELVNAYDEKDRAGAAAAAAAEEKKRKKRKKPPAKKGLPSWVWLAGGGVVLALVIGGVLLKKRGAAQITGA